ncbi:MAG: hypothetical protein JWR18_2321 [Segetibacter sp.]|nr:hypothetical protein [Segetibacter sp.]
MTDKGLNSPLFRKIITVVLFAGISVALVGLYYLVFLPQQHEKFNLRTFRIISEIINNFSERVDNYGVAFGNRFMSEQHPDSAVKIEAIRNADSATINNMFKASFKGDVSRISASRISQKIEDDSIKYVITNGTDSSSTARSFSEILEPIISIHANTFESIILIKQKPDTLKGDKNLKRFDSILYRSAGINITNINTDSLLANRNVVTSALTDIKIEGTDYKMFIVPFKIKSVAGKTFLLAGLITQTKYRQQSQAIPVNFLFTVGFILVLLLLALPFLKIFILSTQENITIADVRLIVAAIFIIPFVITLFTSAIWLYQYPEKFSNDVLTSMQNSIKSNLYNEIKQSIKQTKDFDAIVNNPAAYIAAQRGSFVEQTLGKNPDTSKRRRDTLINYWWDSIARIKDRDAKNLLLYPRFYKNVENVHWMDSSGNDIAAWNFINRPPGYFALRDRQYFRDVLYKRGHSLPNTSDTFAILPTLSRLTGEFTVNIALASTLQVAPNKKAAVVAISTKPYSLYNTVVPPGFAYCLINEKGDILSHSDTARNLQENLFEETGDDHALHLAVNHKDSVLINEINLYEQPVKMMVKPLEGLPYYLVTYYDKRGEYLFIIHILAFVFVCESIVLLFVSLFSYCLMLANKKLYKLFFIPGVLYWLKPSREKKEYYIKNSVHLLWSIFIVFLFASFLSPRYYYLYMLNTSLLLPLFAVTGYYIIKKAKRFKDDYVKISEAHPVFLNKRELLDFLPTIKNILILYGLSVLIFGILQNGFLYNSMYDSNGQILISIWILIIMIPFTMCIAALANYASVRGAFTKFKKKWKWLPFKSTREKPREHNYLLHFILSLLLSVTVISIIPAITFTGYALHEERKLHFQSFQLELAKKIQQRRTEINGKLWQTKILQVPSEGRTFIEQLKFDNEKGLYLFSNKLTKSNLHVESSESNSSPFYKSITQFLFLPPDHDEFYDNPSHKDFYGWKENFDSGTNDSLALYYKNLTDYRDKSSIMLTAGIPEFYIFKDITSDYWGYLIILALVLFILLFYKTIYSIAKRIFLVGYFEDAATISSDTKQEDKPWLKLRYTYIKIEDLCKKLYPDNTPASFAELRQKENEILDEDKNGGEDILKMHLALIPLYEKIWKECSDIEKFTLYDFALDGFTNYKKVTVLYQLIEKGLLIKEDNNFSIMTKSFRNFLITKSSSEEIRILSKEGKGSWAIMRTVFYIILIVVAVFIFISQEEASKRLITIVSSLAALLPVILRLFDKSMFTTSGSKPGS